MTRYAQAERRELVGLLTALGPDAPTMCAGWTTRDLAAHLVVRERRPDAAVGLLVPPLRGHGERVQTDIAGIDYPDLVALVRRPPWWSPVSNRLTDGMVNTMEFFIHHEDVRRAQSEWRPRELPRGEQLALWGRVRWLAGRAARRLRTAILFRAPGYGETTAGRGVARVRVIGAPGELLLFLTGRQQVARVQIDGPDELAARLRGTSLPL